MSRGGRRPRRRVPFQEISSKRSASRRPTRGSRRISAHRAECRIRGNHPGRLVAYVWVYRCSHTAKTKHIFDRPPSAAASRTAGPSMAFPSAAAGTQPRSAHMGRRRVKEARMLITGASQGIGKALTEAACPACLGLGLLADRLPGVAPREWPPPRFRRVFTRRACSFLFHGSPQTRPPAARPPPTWARSARPQ